MAVYKVIQDVEAEDKLLGPLTLKGFVYAAIAGVCAFIEFKLIIMGSPIKYPLMFIFFWPMLLFGVLASPLGRDQPTEVWLLSRVRFFLKPRERIWDQEGLSELVTVTAPKKEELRLTKDITPNEVESRLKSLAATLDTRGWAIKNIDVNLDISDLDTKMVAPDSDRLVSAAVLPREMAVVDVHAADDILDEKNNPTAKKFASLMKEADDERKRGLLASLKGLSADIGPSTLTKKETESIKRQEASGLKKKERATKEDMEKEIIKARSKFNSEFNGRDQKTNPKHKLVETSSSPLSNQVTPKDQSVKMELAQSGNAFSVATLSGLANRQPKIEETGPGEVTISLH